MSLNEELERNLQIFNMLANKTKDKPKFNIDSTSEYGEVSNKRFNEILELEKLNSEFKPYSLEDEQHGIYQNNSIDIAKPTTWNLQDVNLESISYKVNAPNIAEKTINPIEYPEISPVENLPQSDLLEDLVRRIEANSRQFPQDLTEQGGNTW